MKPDRNRVKPSWDVPSWEWNLPARTKIAPVETLPDATEVIDAAFDLEPLFIRGSMTIEHGPVIFG